MSNNNYIKLLNNLQNLKLEQIKENLNKYLDLINENKKDIVDSLYELTTLEIDLKQEKAMNACVRVANFPFIKTLDEFDFSFQPSLNKDKLQCIPEPFIPYIGFGINVACTPILFATAFTAYLKVIILSALVRAFSYLKSISC